MKASGAPCLAFLGSEVVELNKQGCCPARVDDDVMLVAHSILQNPPYRAAQSSRPLLGRCRPFTGAPLRSVVLRSNTLAPTLAKALSIVSAAAMSGSPTLPYRSLMPPGQCSLFEMFQLSAALWFGMGRFLKIIVVTS
jgi:hypothetical protein